MDPVAATQIWVAPLLHKAQVYGRSIHCEGAHEEDLLGKCAVTGVFQLN